MRFSTYSIFLNLTFNALIVSKTYAFCFRLLTCAFHVVNLCFSGRYSMVFGSETIG